MSFSIYPPNQVAGGTINAQVGTSYTPVLADASNTVSLTNAAAISVTIPTNATLGFAIGAEISFTQLGAGQVTIAAATPGTTTILSTASTPAAPRLRSVNSAATAKKLAADTWIVWGDIL